MDQSPDTEWGKDAMEQSTWKVEPKYRLKALLFQDQYGNTAYLEPGQDRPVGTSDPAAARRPTFYDIMHLDEYLGAMEAMLYETERFEVVGRFADLRRRAAEFIGRMTQFH